MSSNKLFCFLVFTTLAMLNTAATFSAAFSRGNRNETDHLALLSFKSMITYDPHGVLSSWNASFHFCDWEGVTCGKRHRRVKYLVLESLGLVGSLSPHVGNLSFLHRVSLFNNTFQGNIPHELGNLFRLQILDLRRNNFIGVIPANLSGCSNLNFLALSYNNLVGKIPVEVSYLSKLTAFGVSYNHITGGIPPSVGNLTLLKLLSLAESPFGGSIPNTLGRLKRLEGLSLGHSSLSGITPPSIYNLSLLTVLSFAGNELSGTLPPAIGEMLPHIEYLQLWGNQLTGSIPQSLSNCSKLKTVELEQNEFRGTLKVNFAGLPNLKVVRLFDNNLGSGEPDEMKFVDSMTNCTELAILTLSVNKFKGLLPNSIGNLSNLDQLHLGSNQFFGNVPSSIGNLVKLTRINLANNRFVGKIPPTIGDLQQLKLMSLSRNRLSGSIPDSFGKLSQLISLYLYSNMLEGEIPSSLGNCKHLLELSLHNNKLTGNIPKQILQLSSLSISLVLSQNNLSGSVPSEVGQLKNLKELDLSDNHLSGTIPVGLTGCSSLENLYLQRNSFQGMIPLSLSSLKGIARLDLSHNNLSGQIPQFLEQFSLEYVNLSLNNFEGKIPEKGVFANASAVSVSGNKKLCGGIQELGLPKCKETKNTKMSVLHIIVISIVCAFLAACTLSVFWFSCHKKKKKGQQSDLLLKDRFSKVSYGELLQATDGFSEANLIGAGGFSSVYKGILDDKTVAVKVLRLENRVAYRSFTLECEAWRNIRHRNLLKIITSCSSVDFQGNDFKALVYEFMANGSLDSWLHSSPRIQRLSLFQRISILLDVATAFDYLHNRSQITIVHCDLKPSNILLNEDMTAHVGDFGLAKFLHADASHNSSVGIRGTIGYAPPEYGLGNEMTTSGDVYSFGILLLETMTGRRPTDNMFNECLNLHQFASMAMPDRVIDIMHEEILNFDEEAEIGAYGLQNSLQNAEKIKDCLASTIKIGVSCSVESSQDRMNIEDVLHQLQHIKDALQNMST